MSKGKRRVKRVERESADLLEESRARLRELFPEVVAEGKIDSAKLREALGDEVGDRPERYSFTWAGKRDAMRLLQVPSRATLVPCPKESVDWDADDAHHRTSGPIRLAEVVSELPRDAGD